MTPHQKCMTMNEFMDWFQDPNEIVHYAQLQNDSLNSEYSVLCDDVEKDGPYWASSWGQAVSNIWIGNSRSVTEMHHDPMENIYAVIKGRKKFRLLPPESFINLNERRVPCGRWTEDMTTETIEGTHLWLDPDLDALNALDIEVGEGECLYLPALWFHEVRQVDGDEGMTIAVNFWYDIDYEGSKWRDWQLIRSTTLCALGRAEEALNEMED